MRYTTMTPALALAGLALAAVTATASADGSLRCKTRLITPGAAAYEVRTVCGIPDDTQSRTESRTVRRAVTVPCNTGYCSAMVDETVTVNVEEWIYDFGPQRFIQFLTFESGKLVLIKSGGYGKKQVVPE
jgi:hypothetical protein